MTEENEASTKIRSRKPSLMGGVALSAATVFLCLVMGEVAIRIIHPAASIWHYPNYIENMTRMSPEHEALIQYDSVLSYVPRPNAKGMSGGQLASFSAEGFRNQTLAVALAKEPLVLAVGDSITEGWAAADDETWPAHLERDTGRRVLNAGVRSYGLDQIVLRAERLAGVFKSQTIVLGFIHDDIVRTTLAVRLSVPKPFFALIGKGLELRNVPVPRAPYRGPHDAVRHVLGYSYLLDYIMRRVGALDLWLGNTVNVEGDADLISCRLMQRFAALVKKQEAKALVVAFPEYATWIDAEINTAERKRVTAVLTCASEAGLPILDAHDGFAAAGVGGAPDEFYSSAHFNDRGNALAAKLIGAALEAK